MVTKASWSDTAVSPGMRKSAGDPPEAGEEAKKGPLWWKRGSVTPDFQPVDLHKRKTTIPGCLKPCLWYFVYSSPGKCMPMAPMNMCDEVPAYFSEPPLCPLTLTLATLGFSRTQRAHFSFKAFACASPFPQNITLPDVHVISIFLSGFA